MFQKAALWGGFFYSPNVSYSLHWRVELAKRYHWLQWGLMYHSRKRSKTWRHASAHALTEEATKTSVILLLIQCFGFDVFNLEDVTPEYIADVGIKKGEKIDFALKIDGKIAILIEAKPISMALGFNQMSQLYRYFGVSGARLAVLTNGKEIWFFSDIDEKKQNGQTSLLCIRSAKIR